MKIPTTLCIAALVAAACDRDAERPAVGQGTKVTEGVAANPARYYGTRLTLVGDVENVLGPRAFTIAGDELWLDADDIVVLTKTPASFAGMALQEDDQLIATGTLRRGTALELERELGWDLEPELEIEVERRPVLVADTLRQIGEYSRWSADPMQTAAGLLAVLMVSDPQALAGQRVAFDNARVQAVSGTAVWVGPTKQHSVMVVPVNAAMLSGIEVGERVIVSGAVRPRTAAKERDPVEIQREIPSTVYIEAMQLQAEPDRIPPVPAS